MSRFTRWLWLICICGGLFLLLGLFSRPATAAEVPPKPSAQSAPSAVCEDGVQDSGAHYRICLPDSYPTIQLNGLIVFAHGYVAFNQPVAIPEDQMALNGISLADLATGLGYAFAATGYYTNGLAVLPALEDLVDLVRIYSDTHGMPSRVYLTGVSEGGLITTLALEQYPDVFDGGMAMCGPYGDFARQANYLGDFRVVFDYFFPDLLPGEAVTVPDELIATWESSYYSETVLPVLQDPANAVTVSQLFNVTGLTFDPANPEATKLASLKQLLWYSVFATNDGRIKLGGQPFTNTVRVYSGSADDAALNAGVARFASDPAAVAELEAHYRPKGHLRAPVVTLHNLGDPLVPYWHAEVYTETIEAAGSNFYYRHLVSQNYYGHCQFDFMRDVYPALMTLQAMVNNPPSQVFLPMVMRIP